MVRVILVGLVVGWGAVFAQDSAPSPVPFFRGKSLPTPPQQGALLPDGDDLLSSAVAALFEQGFPDPRGLEYREIVIATSEPWHGGGLPLETHGWVLPEADGGTRFAIAWDGLVHPVQQVGGTADLRKDIALFAQTPAGNRFPRMLSTEGNPASPGPPNALSVAFLLRLGAAASARQLAKRVFEGQPADPYLHLARDWAWNAFERAVCAHERGDDRLALIDARMLVRIQPLIDAEAKQRGFPLEPDRSDSRFPDRKLSYVPFLTQLPALLADCERRVGQQDNPPPPKQAMAALIDDLQNVDARQDGQPGGVALAFDPRVKALVQHGDEVVPLLLDTMENDERLTRSVSFGRDFARNRHLISVRETAQATLDDLLRIHFDSLHEYRTYWQKMGNLPPYERFYVVLKDDTAGSDQWLRAAYNLVQPTDVEFHSGWTTVPERKPGEVIELRGESLRDGRIPSVAELMTRRSDGIAAIRTGTSNDCFLYLDAARMALYLAAWDKAAAIPVLKRRLARAWAIGTEPDDPLAFNEKPVARYGTVIARMTIARARCGDATAYDEYAVWIQHAKLQDLFVGVDELQKALVEGYDRPSIKQAITYLFNDPQSPWSDALAEGGGFRVSGFWKSPIPTLAEFRPKALRGLADKELAGTITFHPKAEWRSRGEASVKLGNGVVGYGGSAGDPDTPPAGEERSFRICDFCAYFYAQSHAGPNIQLFWPEAKRDAAVQACRDWLVGK